MRKFTTVLAVVLLAFYTGGEAFAIMLTPEPAHRVWIDTDAACGKGAKTDPDDCWALLLALSSPELEIAGISTTYGNAEESKAFDVVTDLIGKFRSDKGRALMTPMVHHGATRPLRDGLPQVSEAVEAMAAELRTGELAIIALGPLTNVAMLIENHPDAANNITNIITVIGDRPGKKGAFAGDNIMKYPRSPNFRKDPDAFKVMLEADMPMTLIPTEAARKIGIRESHLAELRSSGETGAWLAKKSEDWLKHWAQEYRLNEFYPFDALSVGVAIRPELFLCQPTVIELYGPSAESELWVRKQEEGVKGPEALFCFEATLSFRDEMMQRLMMKSLIPPKQSIKDLGRDAGKAK